MRKITVWIAGMCFSLIAFAQKDTDISEAKVMSRKNVPSEIKLMVASFGTIESQSEVEQWLSDLLRPQTVAGGTLQHSQPLDGSQNTKCEAIAIDWKTRQLLYFRSEDEVQKENARRMRVLTDLKTAMLSDSAKRYTQLARDYLQSAIGKQEGGMLVKIIDRGNMTIQQTEKQIKGVSADNVNGADCVLSVVLGDQEKNSVVIPLDMAGTKITRTTYTAPYVGKIRDMDGNVLYAFDGIAQIRQNTDNVVEYTSSDPSRKLIEKVCENIAKDVISFFTARLDFRIKVPSGLDVDDVDIRIDGRSVDIEGARVLACEHFLEATLEGCKSVKRTIQVEKGEDVKRVRINFKK